MSTRNEVNSFMRGQVELTQGDEELVLYLAGCTLAKVPGKQNWLEEDAVSGLP